VECYPVLDNLKDKVHSRYELISTSSNLITEAEPKHKHIPYKVIQQKEFLNKANECFLCLYGYDGDNPYIQAIHRLFRESLKTQNLTSVFNDMKNLYVQMIGDEDEQNSDIAFPKMTASISTIIFPNI
jgi:hypothetical protein